MKPQQTLSSFDCVDYLSQNWLVETAVSNVKMLQLCVVPDEATQTVCHSSTVTLLLEGSFGKVCFHVVLLLVDEIVPAQVYTS